MRGWAKILVVLIALLAAETLRAQTNESRHLILVVGAPGTADYGEQFSNWANLWKSAAAKGHVETVVIGQTASQQPDDRARLLEAIAARTNAADGELWLVFLGHGTFDGRTAKFNLRGPDISAEELAQALQSCHQRMVIVQCASASGPFLKALASPGRIVITATRSGYEVNATHFGGYFARAIGDPTADLDKDGQTSVLEAFLLASHETESFYKSQGRLATEHPLLDDNGDGLGTPPDWFTGLHPTRAAADHKAVDGALARQVSLVRSAANERLTSEARARRDQLETQLEALRARKSAMAEADYYKKLEDILVQIAQIDQSP